MEYIYVGIAVFFNIAIILWKFERAKYADAILDSILLFLVAFLFSGSYGALVSGTVASALVSLYLLINPPKFPSLDDL